MMVENQIEAGPEDRVVFPVSTSKGPAEVHVYLDDDGNIHVFGYPIVNIVVHPVAANHIVIGVER